MGIAVPSGLYTDQGYYLCVNDFSTEAELNSYTVLKIVGQQYLQLWMVGRESLSSLVERGSRTNAFNCAFMQHDPQRLPSVHKNALQMTLKQVEELGRESYALMEFQSQKDIDLTSKIYGDHPLLGDEVEGRWAVQFRSELHMTNHSFLFKGTQTKWPLYEGKMMWTV